MGGWADGRVVCVWVCGRESVVAIEVAERLLGSDRGNRANLCRVMGAGAGGEEARARSGYRLHFRRCIRTLGRAGKRG